MSNAEKPMAADRDVLPVYSPFDGRLVGEVEWVGPGAIETLLAHARAGAEQGRAMPRHRRADILAATADRVAAREESFASLIVAEAGKPIVQARKEVRRCASTLRLSAEEPKGMSARS